MRPESVIWDLSAITQLIIRKGGEMISDDQKREPAPSRDRNAPLLMRLEGKKSHQPISIQE